MGYGVSDGQTLVGKTVREIWMDEDYLRFVTDQGTVTFGAYGDCCSDSYFFDFYGVPNVIGREVVAFEEVDLSPGDPGYHRETFEDGVGDVDYDLVRAYGYRITTEHPAFGHVSAVFSFRNRSNGYYGGWIELTDDAITFKTEDQVLADVIG